MAKRAKVETESSPVARKGMLHRWAVAYTKNVWLLVGTLLAFVGVVTEVAKVPRYISIPVFFALIITASFLVFRREAKRADDLEDSVRDLEKRPTNADLDAKIREVEAKANRQLDERKTTLRAGYEEKRDREIGRLKGLLATRLQSAKARLKQIASVFREWSREIVPPYAGPVWEEVERARACIAEATNDHDAGEFLQFAKNTIKESKLIQVVDDGEKTLRMVDRNDIGKIADCLSRTADALTDDKLRPGFEGFSLE